MNVRSIVSSYKFLLRMVSVVLIDQISKVNDTQISKKKPTASRLNESQVYCMFHFTTLITTYVKSLGANSS